MDFIAIDFETATSNMNSACSLGLVCVKNNIILKSEYYLIQPPGLEFNPINISIHGITPDMVKTRPQFPVVWNEIKHYFNNNTIIAHNAHFDMSVLKCTLDEYSIEMPDFNYCCSITISTEATGKEVKGSLDERAKYFNVNLFNHHNALDDATACAEIVLATITAKGEQSFGSMFESCSNIEKKRFIDLKAQTKFGKSNKKFHKFERVKISNIVPTTDCLNTNNLLYEKNIVLTGDLSRYSRKEAMQIIVNNGGINKSGVSRKTHLLIVGKQDKTLVGDDGLSSKEEKAYDLIDKGFDIKIIKEDEFYNILDSTMEV